MNLSFNFIDFLIVLVIVVSAGYAAWRGFLSETLSIFAWAAAAFGCLYFGPWLIPLAHNLVVTPWLAALLAYAGVFLAVFIPISFVSHRFSQSVKNSPIGPLDRAMGVAFGVVRGLVVVGLAYLAFTYFEPIRQQPLWMNQARLLPLMQSSADVLLSVIPNRTRSDFAGAAPPERHGDALGELIRHNDDGKRVSDAWRKREDEKVRKSYGAGGPPRARQTFTDDRRNNTAMTGDGDSLFDNDTLHEECGVFGIFNHPDAGALSVLGLHALQHRGQEAAGIVTYDNGQFIAERHAGLVGDIFGRNSGAAGNLKGPYAVGHVRYSTAGGSHARNIQPIFADLSGGGLAVAHNGNLTNAHKLRNELVAQGAIFQSTSDTETIVHLAARSVFPRIVDKLIDALKQVEGAYSLVALTSKKLIGVRDPFGVRPLVLGMLEGAPILASETCALDIIGAEFIRDIAPGEMVVCTETGIESHFPFKPQQSRFCVFEYIYFARPDSTVDGRNVYEARKRIGDVLAQEAPIAADMVVPVPDSGVPAALGFANASNIPFELGIIRNHYVGRTFIEPSERIRHLGVRLKHSPNRAKLKGQRVVLVDDSIVRGTTSKKIVEMVRDAGALEVHFRVASPPTTHSCFYGVDTPNTSDLLAHRMDVEGMRRFIGADSLAFISMDGLYRAMGEPGRGPRAHARAMSEAEKISRAPGFCDACFTGEYPIALTDIHGGASSRQLSLLSEVA